MFEALTAYAAQFIVAVIAFLGIWKEWHEKNKRDRNHGKRPYILLTVFTGILFIVTLAETYNTRKAAAKAEADSKLQITGLQSAVTTQTANNDKQYERNQVELHGLRDQLSELKTESATVELRNKITKLEAQLDKSLLPAPKASLVFSFFPLTVDHENQDVPMKDTIRPVSAEGVFSVDVAIANLTKVDAVDGDLNLQICDLCKFVKLPAGFTRGEGQSEQAVYMPFARVLAESVLPKITLDVTSPPTQYGNIWLRMSYRCRTCVLDQDGERILVRLRGDTIQMPPRLNAPAKSKK